MSENSIKRRPFLQSVVCGVFGFLGLGASLEASQGSAQPAKASKLTIGDLFWDKDHAWSTSPTLNFVYLVLSADMKDGVYYYRLGTFMWCGAGYCGAHDQDFTADEVLRMTKVGNIADIKGFAKEW